MDDGSPDMDVQADGTLARDNPQTTSASQIPDTHRDQVLYVYAPLTDEVLVRRVMKKTGVAYRLNDYRLHSWSSGSRLCFYRFDALNSFQKLLLRDAAQQQAKVIPLSAYFEASFGWIEVDLLGPEQLLDMDTRALHISRKKWCIQTIGGKALAVMGIIILLPLAAVVALMIKLDSKGPVFFRQYRTGLYNREFVILKFRSMTMDAEENGAQWAATDDKRITRFGQFLRKTRIDELPQLVNVIRGDMVLIGPRPEREVFIRELEQLVPFYRFRHLVKPGITGLAQVSYGYGASVADAKEKHRHDLYYIKHQSLWLDVRILLKTLKIVLTGKGV